MKHDALHARAVAAMGSGVRGMVVDEADRVSVYVGVAVRGVGSVVLSIPRDKYDGLMLLELVERYSK